MSSNIIPPLTEIVEIIMTEAVKHLKDRIDYKQVHDDFVDLDSSVNWRDLETLNFQIVSDS